MKVVYLEEHLNQFSPPRVWTASLGWKPESETSLKMKKLNRSAAEESRRIRTSLSLIENPSNLSVLVEEETHNPMIFGIDKFPHIVTKKIDVQ